MRCLYEVLECDRSADDGALKKSYRKLALQWHPDKNGHQSDLANDRFREIQNAWEVLSDAQERAWYDSHRDQILRSDGAHQAGGTGADLGVPENPYSPLDFDRLATKAAFHGFHEEAGGFYAVFEAAFSTLSAQESSAFERQKPYMPTLVEPSAPPPFGGPDASAEEFKAFYSYWANFQSIKDFAWEDAYNPLSAPSRKIRRLMEDDNAKKRKAGKRAFVSSVRILVEAIRPRDPRWARIQEEAAERRLLAQERADERREQERQAKQAAADAYREADAERLAEEEAMLQQMDERAADIAAVQMHECIVCDKLYKTEKALSNHYNSKRHKEQLKRFKAMMAEEDDLGLFEDLGIGDGSSSQPQPHAADGQQGPATESCGGEVDAQAAMIEGEAEAAQPVTQASEPAQPHVEEELEYLI